MTEPLLIVNHLAKAYGQTPVLEDINFTVNKGEVVALLGRSGSGKSTLIRTLNGLEPFQGGTLTFAGQAIDPTPATWLALRRRIGMVFQSYDLFPNLTVLANLMLAPVQVAHQPKAQAETAARTLLTRFGLAEFADRYPSALSGGQKQRIAIARALLMKPALMLFDEVTASLDPEMVHGVLALMTDLARADMTMIVVTHEMGFARKVADRILFLDDGRITADMPAEAFFTAPPTESARNFLASMTDR
ncbi:amino acid ABC transporter ATP-binding protein [Lacticaseibacillus daqingensis]|uniref:amino acid ABC transporter ATP-binding protein n=1 Tax=Lacticaseibacillus daqingensis TaxID=2486014 RepID=UPI000F7B0759|nr:amino acid ABC transporter ATP-binding protein [Lacticaseibacillus daqingensis]